MKSGNFFAELKRRNVIRMGDSISSAHGWSCKWPGQCCHPLFQKLY
jgi:hypothetical protein